MTRVKICGISSYEAGQVALEEGADFLGFVFYPPSHRFIRPESAAIIIEHLRAYRPVGWQAVGVVVEAYDAVRLCGFTKTHLAAQAGEPEAK